MVDKKLEQYAEYSGATPPLSLIEEACQKRNNGNPCGLYSQEKRNIKGKEALVHMCGGNSTWCDHITTMGLILSDPRSELHKKVYSSKR